MSSNHMLADHLETCDHCRNKYYSNPSKPTIRIKSASAYSKVSKPTISIKSASTYRKQRKLSELGAIIKGVSYPPISIPVFRTKGASRSEVARKPGPIEREVKLKELGKMIRG